MEKEYPQRTLRQNRALHKYFTLLAESLNDAGYDMRRTLKAEVEIPWNAKTVKEYLWRPVQDAMLRKDSTTELDTKELDSVLEVLTRHIGQTTGVHVEFPSIEMVIRNEQAKEQV